MPTRASAPSVRGIRIVSSMLDPHLWPRKHDYTPKLGKIFPRVALGTAERHRACVLLRPLKDNLRGVLHAAPDFLPSRLSPRETRGVQRGSTRGSAPARGRSPPPPPDSIVAPESGFARPGFSESISANCVRGGRGIQLRRSQSAAGSLEGRNLNGAAPGVRLGRQRRVWAWAPGLGGL